MQSLVEDKRLDLDVPLLSVRRHSVPPPVKSSGKLQEKAVKPPSPSSTSVVPFYKSDIKSGPVRNPGVIPFVWEQKPGQPKTGAAPRNRLPPVPVLPPGWIPNDAEPDGSFIIRNSIRENRPMENAAVMVLEELLKVKEEEDNYSDAIETISRTESFFMNCSLSGLSGIPDAVVPSGSFSTDPQVRNLMMNRFLPAAQAMATGSPQCPPRKPAKLVERVEDGEHRLRRVPLPYQHRPNFFGRYPHDEIDSSDGDNDSNYYEGSGHVTSKACGLLPRLCMKSSFCLLNPVPGMKVGGRRRGLPPSTSRKISGALHNNGPLSQAENELWEAVYKHKLRLGMPYQREGRSKNMTKSNQHGQWSDSQTLDESSSCCHSRGSREAFAKILKSDTNNGKSDGSDSFDKDGQKYWSMSSSHGSQQGSGILSPTMVNSAHEASGLLLGIPHSKDGTTDREIGSRTPKEISKSANMDKQRMEESLGLEIHNGSVLQPQTSGVHESGLIFCSGRSAPLVVGKQNDVEHLNCSDGSLLLKVEEKSKIKSNFHSLLPPPLPKTPSESWLSRTLPSVSAKITSGQPGLGIDMLQRKQSLHSSSTLTRQESNTKPLESQHPQVSCVDAKQEVPCKPSIPHLFQITPAEHSEESSIKRSEPQNDQILNMKPSKPPRRQIRFADVLMMPLSPRSEM